MNKIKPACIVSRYNENIMKRKGDLNNEKIYYLAKLQF